MGCRPDRAGLAALTFVDKQYLPSVGGTHTRSRTGQFTRLLGTLEDARDALIESGHLAVVVAIEAVIRTLSRKLDFDDPAGGSDGR